MWYRSRAVSRRRAKPQRRNLPRLEMLEDRTVPSYLFRTFNIPGAGTAPFQGTLGGDINNLGQVAGEFLDANSVYHGFLGSSSLTIIDDPNAGTTGTLGFDLNDQGQVVGSYNDASGVGHGFLLSQGQFTTLDDPGTTTLSDAIGINAAGQIVGEFLDANNVFHGFLLSGGQYTTLDDPSAGSGAFQGTQATGINAAGQIVGEFVDANNLVHGFLLSGGQYSTLDDASAGSGGTQASRINDAGQIVGSYEDANSVFHAFLLSGGQYTTLDDPNAGASPLEGTVANGINDAGQIVGAYIADANLVIHGFLATPDPASSASRPASVNGGSANGLLPASALTNATLANHPGIGTASSFVGNRDVSGGIAPHQSTIIATVPHASQGSDTSARIYVISATPVSAGNHADPVSAVFAEGRLWSWQ